MTLEAWMKDWLTVHGAEVRERTIESYTDIVYRYIVPALGGLELDAITPGEVLHLLADVVALGYTRTAELIHVILRAALAEMRPDLMRRVRRPVHVQRVPEPWTDEEIAIYIDGLRGHRQELPLLLGIRLGLRRGEICGLRWSDVDLTRRELRIVNNVQPKHLEGAPKSRAGQRRLPIPDDLLPLMRERYSIGGMVCTIAPHSLDKAHRKLVARLGLPPIPLHGLRHSMATACLRNGCDLRTLQLILGHATMNTTAQRYTHPDMHMLRHAVETAHFLCYYAFRHLKVH